MSLNFLLTSLAHFLHALVTGYFCALHLLWDAHLTLLLLPMQTVHCLPYYHCAQVQIIVLPEMGTHLVLIISGIAISN